MIQEMTVEEASKYLLVSPQTIYRWLKLGRIKGKWSQLNNSWLIGVDVLHQTETRLLKPPSIRWADEGMTKEEVI